MITFTTFTNAAAKTKRETTVEWAQLVERIKAPQAYATKERMPWIKLARFGSRRSDKGSLRRDENVDKITGIEGDYDGEKIAMTDAATMVADAGIIAVFYTSPSSRPDAPRWRVLCPLSREHPPEEREQIVGRLNRIIGGILASESFVLSQSYYVGRANTAAHYETQEVVGRRCIDEAIEIEPLITAKKINGEDTEGAVLDATDDQLRETIRTGKDGVQRALLSLSARWIAREMDEHDVRAALVALLDAAEWKAREPERWKERHASVDRCVRTAVEKFSDKRTRDASSDDPKAEESAADSAAREIARIAALPEMAYERERQEIAKRLKIRTTALDRIVARERESQTKTREAVKMFPTVEPWGQSVDGALLLDALSATFRRFVVLPEHAYAAVALWTLFTYTHDCFQHSPLLLPRSATKRCGKTTLVGMLRELVHRPLASSNLTSAVVFRVIEAYHPTLLIDEVDSFLDISEELRGILNSGHARDAAVVFRVEELNGERQTVGFSTWAPKLLAMIGRPPATVLDRSISIRMQRKLRGDCIEKRRHANIDVEALRARCLRWAMDHAVALTEARPAIPEALNDRQADSWEPLLAIADRAGGEWPARAREAAVGLSAADAADLDQAELLEELLRDVREAFNAAAKERPTDAGRISCTELVNALVAMDGRPWGECNKGRQITTHWVGRRLSPLAIASKPIRFADSGENRRGYERKQFEDAWSRYTP